MVGLLQPLVDNQRIVRTDGTPTEYFIRWAQQRQIDIGDAISEERAIEIITEFFNDNPLLAGSGIDLSPSGNILDGVTISAEVQAILNQISSTHGSVLFRGASDWEALAPGTAGHVLSTNGAAADPTWIAQSGGGGGGSTLIPPSPVDPLTNSGLLVAAQIMATAAVAESATQITGIVLPSRTVPGGHQAAPVLYEGNLMSALGAIQANSTTLVASGPFVTPTANTFNPLPFTTPFTPTVGRIYYVGFSFKGTTNFNTMALSYNRRTWFSSGTFDPPPAAFPAGAGNASGNFASWWTY